MSFDNPSVISTRNVFFFGAFFTLSPSLCENPSAFFIYILLIEKKYMNSNTSYPNLLLPIRQSSNGVEGILAVIALLTAIGFFMNGISGGAVQSALFPGAQMDVDGIYSGPITPRMSHVDAINSATSYNEGASTTTRWLRN